MSNLEMQVRVSRANQMSELEVMEIMGMDFDVEVLHASKLHSFHDENEVN